MRDIPLELHVSYTRPLGWLEDPARLGGASIASSLTVKLGLALFYGNDYGSASGSRASETIHMYRRETYA